MQSPFESPAFNPASLVLSFPKSARAGRPPVSPRTAGPSLDMLRQARRDALREQAWEQAVWIALGLLGLAGVAVSFWGLAPLAICP